jgi:copper oxidase (laccase) domain-containing protein
MEFTENDKREFVFQNVMQHHSRMNAQPDFWLLKQYHGTKAIPVEQRSEDTKKWLHDITIILYQRGLLK